MELNREQIIKALECCSGTDDDFLDVKCNECPYKIGTVSCRHLDRDALCLINELTEENKAWQQRLISQEEKADKAYHDLACEVEDLRAENERLRDTAYRLECEVHRERANTVRKMQERLKAKAKDNEWNGTICGEDIDQIAEEMLEGIE